MRARILPQWAVLLAGVVTSTIAGGSFAQDTGAVRGHDATSHRRFDDPEYWSKIFDDPGRDAWQKPAEVVRVLGVRSGMTVADLGAGTGYFEPHLARAVGPRGTVLAVEVEPKLVAHLRDRAERENTPQVVPILASRDNPRLPAGSVDLVVLVDTYHHIDARVRYFKRLARCLAPGGRVAVIDWRPGDTPVGPPANHRLPPEHVVKEMEEAGYRLMSSPEFLPYQYFLLFERARPTSAR